MKTPPTQQPIHFLLDNCIQLNHDLLERVKGIFTPQIQVTSVRNTYHEGQNITDAPDSKIGEYASQKGIIVITNDRDFHGECRRKNGFSPAVICLNKVGHYSPPQLFHFLVEHKQRMIRLCLGSINSASQLTFHPEISPTTQSAWVSPRYAVMRGRQKHAFARC